MGQQRHRVTVEKTHGTKETSHYFGWLRLQVGTLPQEKVEKTRGSPLGVPLQPTKQGEHNPTLHAGWSHLGS